MVTCACKLVRQIQMRIYNPKKYFKRHGVAAQGRAQNFVPRQSLIFTLEIIIVCRVRSQKYFTLLVSANQRLRVLSESGVSQFFLKWPHCLWR